MNKTVKWILGVLIALLVIGAVAAALWLAWGGYGGMAWMMGAPGWRLWDGGQDLPRYQSPWRGMPMHPYNRLPGFLPWAPFGGFFGGLICLGGLAVIVLGLVALAANLLRSPKAAAPTPAASTPVAGAAGEAAAPTHACPNCARTVQDDWSHCPYCGSGLKE